MNCEEKITGIEIIIIVNAEANRNKCRESVKSYRSQVSHLNFIVLMCRQKWYTYFVQNI